MPHDTDLSVILLQLLGLNKYAIHYNGQDDGRGVNLAIAAKLLLNMLFLSLNT